MAVITATSSRQEKEKWLLRPFNWASHVSLSGFIMLIGLWTDPHAKSWTADFIAIGALATLAIVTGLLLWGVRRVLCVTRGQV